MRNDPAIGSQWRSKALPHYGPHTVVDVTDKRIVTRSPAGHIDKWSFGEFEEDFEPMPGDQPPMDEPLPTRDTPDDGIEF